MDVLVDLKAVTDSLQSITTNLKRTADAGAAAADQLALDLTTAAQPAAAADAREVATNLRSSSSTASDVSDTLGDLNGNLDDASDTGNVRIVGFTAAAQLTPPRAGRSGHWPIGRIYLLNRCSSMGCAHPFDALWFDVLQAYLPHMHADRAVAAPDCLAGGRRTAGMGDGTWHCWLTSAS